MERIKCLSKLSLAAEGFTVRAYLGLLDASYDEFLVNIGTVDDPVFTDFSALDFRRAPRTYGLEVGFRFLAGQSLV